MFTFATKCYCSQCTLYHTMFLDIFLLRISRTICLEILIIPLNKWCTFPRWLWELGRYVTFGFPCPKVKSQISCTFTANLKSCNLGGYFNYSFPWAKYSETILYSYCIWVLLEAPSNNFRETWHRSKLYKWNSLSLIHFSCFF